MGLFDKLFGKASPSEAADLESDTAGAPRGILVVFANRHSYTTATLLQSLQKLSPGMQSVTVQVLPGTESKGTPVHRISWADHVVDVVGLDAPLPKTTVENCVQPAHYPQEAKAAVRANRSHAILYYSGSNHKPLEQYIAMSAVAAAFATLGAVGVLNESAMTSLPASVVRQLAVGKPNFDLLRHMPLLMLYCGFVKYFLPDNSMAWMRTYNNPAFGLPDLAVNARADQAQRMFDLFQGLMSYLLSSKAKFKPGHTAEFGTTHLRFRAPRDDEPFPTHSTGQLLIAEIS
jgi:Domain of unknown function (DUF4261)